jgi:hypothetical protein
MTAASVIDDVLSGFRAGSKNAKTWGDFFTNTLKNADSQTYRAYSSAMGTALSADPALIRTFTNAVDDATITAVLRNADNDVAEALVKNMDNASLARVAKVDPVLARNLNFADVKPSDFAEVATRQGATTAQAKNLQDGALGMMENQVPINAAQTKTVTRDTSKGAPLSPTDELAKETTVSWVRSKAGVVESVSDANLGTAIENGGKIAQNSGTVRTALEKLGIIAVGSDIATFTRKHWMKMGAAMVILCMAYDTNNPFTALDRAIDDVDEIVDGLKDLADSATEAAGNAAKGTFDLISFLTENWWMSFACCVMLLFIGVAATLS